ncbi:MAG TPA: RNA methyltransferase [Polyangiaceae bacterium]|jgi:tRNA/rRNA methyltransferase
MSFDKPRVSPKPMLVLPVHEATRFVLVKPHYPENVGASARAIKTMGFTQLCLVKPSKLAVPEHEMAIKMAVKAWDVLESAARLETVGAAVEGIELVLATTSRRGSPVIQPREAAARVLTTVAAGGRAAFLFGNEKTGLSEADASWATLSVRIPMAADQPSINLAQATQLIAYELFLAALAAR